MVLLYLSDIVFMFPFFFLLAASFIARILCEKSFKIMWRVVFWSLENDGVIQCQFPGHEIFTGIHALLRLKAEYKFFIKNDRQVVC